ncbi:hypothetical protein [Mesorhizobium sp. WSM3864]|uniref:hypothetical protein n=1 Tax=Mesorhizobium sp. WSM3864 TaxID=2029404 RepID=UPI001482C555|nr:hypothetical protein [Mesorhizobium sp. WSM3864]
MLLATIRQQLLPQVFGQDLHGGLLFVSLRRAQDDPPVDGQCVEEERSALAVVVGEEGADVDPEALLAFPGVAHGVGLVERPFRLGLVLRLLVMVFPLVDGFCPGGRSKEDGCAG